MKECPYCRNLLQDQWSYCHFCNKPLLTKLQDQSNITDETFIDGNREYSFDLPYSNSELNNKQSLFEFNLIKEEEIDYEIQKIDNEIDRKVKIGESIGELLLEKASLYNLKKEYNIALETLENALNYFQELNDILNSAITHNEIGLIQEDLGFYDNSIYNFEKSIENLQKINEKVKLTKVYNNLANVFYLINDIEHSYEYYNKALELAERENLISEEIKTSSNLVDILFILEEYDKITKILERNLEYFQQIGDPYGSIITLTKQGILNFFLGSNNFNISFQYIQKALEIINQIKLSKNFTIKHKAKLEWELFLYLGKLFVLQEKYKQAENYFFRSLEAVRIAEIEVKESIVLENLGFLFEKKRDYNKSIEYYNLAREIYYKFGDDLNYAELTYKIANVYSKYDNIEAIRLFEESLELFKELNYSKRIAEILHKLGDIYLNKGIIELAITHFQEAKSHYEDLNDEFNIKLLTEKINSLLNSNTNNL
ncbi:MAG: tetratricopeptide repeat protein [Promethearchaeota archaeon]|nr:MAG: tetratricopeptide repeat protein [Candidatus Lokiarchaeota archaeon]